METNSVVLSVERYEQLTALERDLAKREAELIDKSEKIHVTMYHRYGQVTGYWGKDQALLELDKILKENKKKIADLEAENKTQGAEYVSVWSENVKLRSFSISLSAKLKFLFTGEITHV